MEKNDIKLHFIRKERAEYNIKWVKCRNKLNLENNTKTERECLLVETEFLKKYLSIISSYEKYLIDNNGDYIKKIPYSEFKVVEEIKSNTIMDWIALRSEINNLKAIGEVENCKEVIGRKEQIFGNLDIKLNFLAEVEMIFNGFERRYISADDYKNKCMNKLNKFDNEFNFNVGDHIYVDKYLGIYTHHGIYIGDEKVIHYSGLANGFESGKIEEIGLAEFKKGSNYLTKYIYDENSFFYQRHKIVERAKSRLNEDSYNLFRNNCEHFAHWCVTGENYSTQIAGVFLMPIRIPIALVLGGLGSLVGK